MVFEPGNYTFSAYIKTTGLSVPAGKKGAFIRVTNYENIHESEAIKESTAGGIHTQKVKKVNGTITETTDYILKGKQIAAMKKNTDTYYFTYDASGAPATVNFNGANYTYVKNLQGDIVGILDASGTLVVEYKYDAWGAPTYIYSASIACEDLAFDNPFRYRGYVWDEETGLYYLRSRYYNPEITRLVNEDSRIFARRSIISNLFTYCENNPIGHKDPTGNIGITALAVMAVFALCAGTLTSCTKSPTIPSNYIAENSANQNCYSYAFGLPHAANPGQYSIIDDSSDYMFKSKRIYSPDEIVIFILNDMEALSKSVRLVSSPEDKQENEYIVAMKTSDIIIPSIGVADYHFAVQLSDGTWADKPGSTPSRWNALDGTAKYWDLGGYKDYYNTDSKYFAVER